MKMQQPYDKPVKVLPNSENIKITIIADAHGGSKYGIMPPGTVNKEGGVLTQTRLQRRLWKGYVKALNEIGETDVLIVGGDMAEGKQVKIAGVTLSDSDTDIHVSIGSSVLNYAIEQLKPKTVLCVAGTDYHTTYGVGGNLDYQIADKLIHDDVSFGYVVNAEIGKSKTLWNLQHKISIANVNQLMPAEKIFRFYYRDLASNRIKRVPDVVARFHMHRVQPPTIIDSNRYFIRGACLKGKDPYIATLSYPSNPDVGVLQVEQVDGRLESYKFHRIELQE